MNRAHAIQIDRYGSPDVLIWSEVLLPPLLPREVRIRTLAAAVNHTDLEIRSGSWPIAKPVPFPYVPGVEVVGTIDEVGRDVGEWDRGQTVITMMQGLGGVRAERAGGYAEFVIVHSDAVAAIPANVDVLQMAALGLVGVTAYLGLDRIGNLAGKRILITGAAGGVGSAATTIARALGATPVGLIAREEQRDYVRELGATEVIISDRAHTPALELESVDGVLDTVAGGIFGPSVGALRAGGVLSLVGAVGGSEVTFDAWHLLHPVTLTGYSSEALDGPTLRRAIAVLSDGLAEKKIQPPNYRTMALSEAARAHATLERGGLNGRLLLIPASVDSYA